MDSTTFSMNFRSLARSDSGAESKTPMGVRVPFGERTPSQTDTAPSLSDLMVVTGANKQVSHSSLAVNKVNYSGNSDDMSLVGENYRRYDYGELPPELDVLLAEGNKDVESVPLTGDVELSNSTSELNTENGHKFSGHKIFDQTDTRVTGFSHDTDLSKISGEAISVDHMNHEKGNDDISNAAIGETVQNYSKHVDNGPGHLSPSGDKIQATYLHIHDNQLGKKDEGGIGSEVIEMFKSPPLITQSELLHELPIEGSISSLLPKLRDIFRDSNSLPKTGLVNCRSKDSNESELETHATQNILSMQSNSCLPDITFNDLNNSCNGEMPGDFACSPRNVVKNNVSSSPLNKRSPLKFNIGHQGEKGTDDLASTVEDYSSLLVDKINKSKLTSFDTSHAEDVLQHRLVDENQLINSSKSALKDKVSKSCNVISSNDDVDTRGTLISSTKGLRVRNMHSVPGSTLSSNARSDELPEQVFGNPKGGPVDDMLKETLDLRDDPKANIFDEQNDATLNKPISKYTRDDQLLQKPPDICANDCPSSHKRKLFDDTQDYIDHASPLQRKARLCKDQTNYEEKHKVSHCIENASESRDWTDVFTSLCRVTKELLTPTSDKFDVALIANLADILVHLDKLKSYELLHHELGSRNSLDSAHFVHSRRLANTKLLLYSTVYQKAKLQLLRLKRDKLLDQAYRMKSRVEESESILSSCHHMSKRGKIDQVGCLQLGHHSTNAEYRSSVSAEIDSLRKEVEDSDGEIRKISKSFYPYIREMKDLTSTETVESVKGLLKKMVACQLLRSELQLSEVEKLHAAHGLPNVTFDHGGFLSQSFITKSTATSGLLVTNRWNKEKILKMFINDMDAYTAFSFVLSGDTQLKYESLRNILEQTQKTVSLLHILLDVVEEVQLSMIELKSLTWSRFSQATAEKLDMQLCFTNFRSGAKVTLSIDVSCLKQGVYPSEVLPYDVRGITARNHEIFESLVADIQTAIRGAKCGFMRIMSICRCVSRMIETGGM